MSKMRLMEGDWVNCDGAEAFIRLASGHRLMVQHKFGSFDKFLNTANIEPIPLTAEILRDWFGFKPSKGYSNNYVKSMNIEGWDFDPSYSVFHILGEDEEECFIINDNNYTTYKYVHELQRKFLADTLKPLERIDI